MHGISFPICQQDNLKKEYSCTSFNRSKNNNTSNLSCNTHSLDHHNNSNITSNTTEEYKMDYSLTLQSSTTSSPPSGYEWIMPDSEYFRQLVYGELILSKFQEYKRSMKESVLETKNAVSSLFLPYNEDDIRYISSAMEQTLLDEISGTYGQHEQQQVQQHYDQQEPQHDDKECIIEKGNKDIDLDFAFNHSNIPSSLAFLEVLEQQATQIIQRFKKPLIGVTNGSLSSSASLSKSNELPLTSPRKENVSMEEERTSYCELCEKDGNHSTDQHKCHYCQKEGHHRGKECPKNNFLRTWNHSLETVRYIYDHLSPKSAACLVSEGVENLFKKSLSRFGILGGGSQTPVTTPQKQRQIRDFMYCKEKNRNVDQKLSDTKGLSVLSYLDRGPIIPHKLRRYMRMLMHHDISTNGFEVVVEYDEERRLSISECPGMVTPESFPPTPSTRSSYETHMDRYTTALLNGVRHKLLHLSTVQDPTISNNDC